jgi:hypothetical protein
MITKQDMIKLALELSFAQIDLELSQLYVDDFDDKLEGRLKKLRMNFYFDSLEYFLDDESLKKIEEYELKQIKIKEATCEKIDYEKILNGLE